MANQVVTFIEFLKESTYSDWQALNSLGIADVTDLAITAVEVKFKGKGLGDLISDNSQPQFIEFIKDQSIVCVGVSLNKGDQTCTSRWIGPADSIKELAELLSRLELPVKINRLEELSVHTRWWLYAMKRNLYLLSSDGSTKLFT